MSTNAPQQTAYDIFDAPGVVTTSVTSDSSGNIIIAGLMSDTHDFDRTESVKTVGVYGDNFEFIAKFDKDTNFEWIRCLREESLYHVYKGLTVHVDSSDNVFVCNDELRKFSSQGSLQWSQPSNADWTCEIDTAGNSYVSAWDEPMHKFNAEGKEEWSIKAPFYSRISVGTNGDFFAASTTDLARYTSQGKKLWAIHFSERPAGSLIEIPGQRDPEPIFSTSLVGLQSASDGSVVIALPLNKKNDFDPSATERIFNPGSIQDVVLAKYSSAGELVWANKLELPKSQFKASLQYLEAFDISLSPNHDLLILGGGKVFTMSENSRLFLARFSLDGTQRLFTWLEEYHDFFFDVGHELTTDAEGNAYTTAERHDQAPFLTIIPRNA